MDQVKSLGYGLRGKAESEIVTFIESQSREILWQDESYFFFWCIVCDGRMIYRKSDSNDDNNDYDDYDMIKYYHFDVKLS